MSGAFPRLRGPTEEKRVLNFFGRIGAAFSALPGVHLLLFTLAIWAVFTLILLSNPKNRLNRWCFVGGMVFSVGAFKEYLFYGIGPSLVASGVWTQSGAQLVYSCLSAVFYLLAIPCVLMFAFCFARLEQTRVFSVLRVAVWLPAVYLCFIFPPTRVCLLQKDPVFCLSIAGYNWLGGLAASAVMLRALRADRRGPRYRQRRLAAVSVLLPLWVWLVVAFPYHALGVPNLSKIWQIELPVVLFILVFCLYHAFREGIWGLRLRRETYDWSGNGGEILQRNTQYVAHALKNDLNKIDWCAAMLADQMPDSREVAIIRGSTDHLRMLIRRTRLHTDRIILEPELCDVRKLFEQVVGETPAAPDLTLSIGRCDGAPLLCDRTHIRETLNNLVANAAEAMNGAGHITLSYTRAARRAVIAVADDGPGIPRERQKRIFEPYFSTKTSGENFGLGLYYCRNVMEAHGGSISVESAVGRGSTFSLRFYPPKKGHTRE